MKPNTEIERETNIKSLRENSTFGFCQHAKCQPKKTKKPVPTFFREAIFCQRSTKIATEKLFLQLN